MAPQFGFSFTQGDGVTCFAIATLKLGEEFSSGEELMFKILPTPLHQPPAIVSHNCTEEAHRLWQGALLNIPLQLQPRS